MHCEVVLTFGIHHLDTLALGSEPTRVAYLSTHLCVERRAVQHYLIEFLVLLFYLAVTQDGGFAFEKVVADKLRFAFAYYHPVACLHCCCVACTFFLLAHLNIEASRIYLHTVLAEDKLREVEREAVGVVEREGIGSAHDGFSCRLRLCNLRIQEADTRLKRAEESFFLFLYHLLDKYLLRYEFGVGVAHCFDEDRHEAVEKGFAPSEEGVAVAHCTAQDTADDVAGSRVRGQLPVGDGESYCADMVCHDAHGNVLTFVFAVGCTRHAGDGPDDWLEYIRVVV